jgi:aldose 1-epimerase
MEQTLILPGRFYLPADEKSIPTGECKEVAGTPMDFRMPKVIGAEIGSDYPALQLQNGYDHCFEVFTDPCAILCDPVSGRTMAVTTDCPGIHLYTGNFVEENGKNGVVYPRRSGVCFETQYYPDSMNHPQWPQPITPAQTPYRSTTTFQFHW